MTDPETTIETGPEQDTDLDRDLAAETLVEEVSIDGMCGVY
jgi:mycofactocin precursor